MSWPLFLMCHSAISRHPTNHFQGRAHSYFPCFLLWWWPLQNVLQFLTSYFLTQGQELLPGSQRDGVKLVGSAGNIIEHIGSMGSSSRLNRSVSLDQGRLPDAVQQARDRLLQRLNSVDLSGRRSATPLSMSFFQLRTWTSILHIFCTLLQAKDTIFRNHLGCSNSSCWPCCLHLRGQRTT